MRKKIIYILLLFIILSTMFFLGAWYGTRENATARGGYDEVPLTVVDGEDYEMEEYYPPETPGTVQITPERQQLIGVRVGEVEENSFQHTIRVLGRVQADEVRTYRIVASLDGWIQEAYDNSAGTLVKKGEILATYFNPLIMDAEQAYIYALDALDRAQPERRQELGRKNFPVKIALDQLALQRQVDTLRGMGICDSQIDEIGRTRKIFLSAWITAPATGFILYRNVSPEQRFVKGTELYRIADLSRVWILVDVYAHEVQYFKPGTEATVRLPYQDKTYQAKVSKVLPDFDAESRTLKVRLETDNPGFVLRPDMFADVELSVELDPTISIPAGAVVYTGLRKTVFVAYDGGYFEPRQVETGWRMGDRVQILEGLEPGERIVISGNFLIDSESRIQAVALGIYGDMAVDPVCFMEVDEFRARATGLTSEYLGKTYYFCSAECKEEFEEDPALFVESAEKEPSDEESNQNEEGEGLNSKQEKKEETSFLKDPSHD